MKALSLVVLLLGVVGVGWGQGAYPIFNETDQVLRDHCIGNPLSDGTQYCLYWDMNGNGPDVCDYPLSLPPCLFLNGEAQEIGAGLFVGDQPMEILHLPQPSRFFVLVSGQNFCWWTNTFTLSPGVQTIELQTWYCSPDTCSAWSPPPPITLTSLYEFRCPCVTGEPLVGDAYARVFLDLNHNGPDEQDTLSTAISWSCQTAGECEGLVFLPCFDSVSAYVQIEHGECCYMSEVRTLTYRDWLVELRGWTCNDSPCANLAAGEPNTPVARSHALRVSPNPFNAEARIEFAVEQRGNAELVIYDVQGRLVETLLDGMLEAGEHVRVWRAGNRASGVYFARLSMGADVRVEKLLLMK